MQVVIGIILILASIFLVVAVLMQSGKANNGLSGAIAGGAETFFGKTKGKTLDKMLNRLTTIVAIVFVVLVIIVYVIQPDTVKTTDEYFNDNFSAAAEEVAAAADENAVSMDEALAAVAEDAAEDAAANE